jgi:hypothetical protein
MPLGGLLAAGMSAGAGAGAAGAAGAGAAGAGAGGLGSLSGLMGKIGGGAGGAGGGKAGGFGQIGKLAMSGGQMILGAINRRKADAALPMSENPMERQMLNTIRRRRQALQTGTANSADRAAMRQMAKGYQTGAMRSGGPVNFGQYNQLIQNAAGNLAAANGQQLNQVLGLEKDQTKDMVNTANDLALLKSANRRAIGEDQMKAGTQNLLATLGGGDAEAKKKKLLEEEAAKAAQGGQASQVGTAVLGALG